MSAHYVWIDLLLNYEYFSKHLGNITTALEQYNVNKTWYCFLFDTLNLDTDEDIYQQKKYYTNDVLNVLRNNFIAVSYIDQHFKAFVLAKDVIYNFFLAIPTAFDNRQLRPCYSLVYPEFFLGIYFYRFNLTQPVVENICGYELREAIRTIIVNPYTPNPMPSPYDPDPDNPSRPPGPYHPPQPITPPLPGPPPNPGTPTVLPDDLEIYLWHEGNTPTDFPTFQKWCNKILAFIEILNTQYTFHGKIYVMFKLGPPFPGSANNAQKWDLPECKTSIHDSSTKTYPWFVTELFDHLGDPAKHTENVQGMVLGDVGTKYDWPYPSADSPIGAPGTPHDNLYNFFSYVKDHINTTARLDATTTHVTSGERNWCVYDVAFDHEGLGSYQNDTIYGGDTRGDLGGGVGWLKKCWNDFMPTSVKVVVDSNGVITGSNTTYRFGWANYQPAPTHKNSQGNNMAYAELYWIGELTPEGCIHYDTTYQSCTNTFYRKHIGSSPDNFLEDGFKDWKGNESSFKKHLTADYFQENNTIGGITNIHENNIPLLAIEFLSGGKYGQCLNNSPDGFSPGETDGSVCGTFDGFGCWSLEQYMGIFERLTSPPYNFKRLGLYELSFLPTKNPDWFTT